MVSIGEKPTNSKTSREQDIPLSKRFLGLEKNTWIEFITLAVEHKTVNLGQGFIDYDPPKFFLDIYSETVNERNTSLQQYTRGFGHRRLVEALSNVYSLYMNRKRDPLTEILITGGGYPSVFNAINTFLNPGDEENIGN